MVPACDFFVVVTATFQHLYVLVVLDIATRRVIHWNVTDHQTAEWTIQQFRNGLPLEVAYRLVVRDRDGILAPAVDEALAAMSLRVLRTPPRAPQANAYCERFHRHCSARVSRLDDSTPRAAPPPRVGRVDSPLQW